MNAPSLKRVRETARRWLAGGGPADQLTLAAAVPALLAHVAYLERLPTAAEEREVPKRGHRRRVRGGEAGGTPGRPG